jgi:outer membrane protein assembly factor BamD (BamD/ComL family)
MKEEDKTATWSPNRIYAEAKDEMNSGNWDKAVPLLEKLEGRAAGTPLAQYEVHVAHYYFTRGAYVAAVNRAQAAIADYRDVPAIEEALYILVRSYDALNMPKLRDDAQRVLKQNYPNSTYLTEGFGGKKKSWWQFW